MLWLTSGRPTKNPLSNSFCFVVPFPGNGQQRRFLDAMARIVPALPRAK